MAKGSLAVSGFRIFTENVAFSVKKPLFLVSFLLSPEEIAFDVQLKYSLSSSVQCLIHFQQLMTLTGHFIGVLTEIW